MQYTEREREAAQGTKRCSIWYGLPPYLYLYLYLICSRLSYRTCCSAACLVLVFSFVSFRLWFWGLSLVDFGLHCWHLALAFFCFLLFFTCPLDLGTRCALGPTRCCPYSHLFSGVAGVNLLLFLLLSVTISPTPYPLPVCAPIS